MILRNETSRFEHMEVWFTARKSSVTDARSWLFQVLQSMRIIHTVSAILVIKAARLFISFKSKSNGETLTKYERKNNVNNFRNVVSYCFRRVNESLGTAEENRVMVRSVPVL